MGFGFPVLMAAIPPEAWIGIGIVGAFIAVLLAIILYTYGAIWFQAYMSDAHVGFVELVGMSFGA